MFKNKILYIIYEKYIKQILIVYIILQPFIDVFVTLAIKTTDSIVNIGIILRGLFLIYAGIYLLLNKSKSIRICTIVVITYFLIHIGLAVFGINSIKELFPIISNFFKIYYLPITIMFFYSIQKVYKEKNMTINLATYISIIIISYLFNIGYSTYLLIDRKEGFLGVFNSANEISAILVGLLPLALCYTSSKWGAIKKGLLILGAVFVSFIIGTKVALIGVAGILFIFAIWLLNKKITSKKIKIICFSIIPIIIIILSVIIFPRTNVYKNYIIATDFFEIENLNSIDSIDKIIFSSRLEFLRNNAEIFKELPIIQQIFGSGNVNIYIKTVEIDYFDILFLNGLVGLIVWLIPIVYVLYKSIKNNKEIQYIFTIGIFFLAALFTGHVFLAPAVSIYLAIIPNIMKDGDVE